METEVKEVIWEGTPSGIVGKMLSNVGLSSTVYKVVGDELILKEGFFNRRTKVIKLDSLCEPKLVESLYQRIIKVGTIYLKNSEDGKVIVLKNLKDPEGAREIFTKILNNEQKNSFF